MSRLGINTGINPNDGQGDTLRSAMGKVNSNFLEIYQTIGDGFTLVSYANTAGISTLSENLTGNPTIEVSGLSNTGITTTEHIEVRNITSTGIITAVQFVGDGSQLTDVTATNPGIEVLDENVRRGVAQEINFGNGLSCSLPDGVGRVTVALTTTIVVGGGGTGVGALEFRTQDTTLGNYQILNFGDNLRGVVDTVSGVVTVTTAPGGLNISGVVTATSFAGDGSNLTGLFSGDYADLSNKPTIPSDTGDLTNGVGFVTSGIVVGYATEGYVDNLVSISTFSGDYNDLTNRPTIPSDTGDLTNSVGFVTTGNLTGYVTTGTLSGTLSTYATVETLTGIRLTNLSDVNAGAPSTGQVLKWSGSEWQASSDLTAAGAGIGLSDLSVTLNTPGSISTLSYNNVTGVFEFSPADLTGYATTESIVGFVTSGIIVGYATEGYVDNLVSISTFSGDYNDLTNRPTIPVDTGDLTNNIGFVTAGVVIGYATEGYVNNQGFVTSGIIVGYATEGYVNNLVSISTFSGDYNDLTNKPTIPSDTGDLTNSVGFVTAGYVGMQTFVGAATTITTTQISNWDTAYSWGNHSTQGYLTNVNITAGANIDVVETSEGNFIITSTSVGGGSTSPGYWEKTDAGINTVSNVGVGTTNPIVALQVERYGTSTGIGTFTASVGVSEDVDTFDMGQYDFKTLEYTLHVGYGTYVQAQKVLVMHNNTFAFAQEYGVMYEPSPVVSVGATITAGICKLQLTPESGISGTVSYTFVRGALL